MKKPAAIAKKMGIRRAQLVILAVCLTFTVLFHAVKGQKGFIDFVTDFIVSPVQRVLAWICSLFSFSVTEVVIVLLVTALLVFLVQSVVCIVRRKGERFRTFCTRTVTLLCAVLIGTTAFDWMWGSYYYRTTLQQQTGVTAKPVSAQELYDATILFVQQANALAEKLPRGADGDLLMDPEVIVRLSVSVYDALEEQYPVFGKPRTAPKVLWLSEGLSYLNCTGFYFPYLGESNLNGHAPRTGIPATAAHELAHQMGIASEQEANFAAVLACTQSAFPEFAYSGWQMGLIHLINALHRADKTLWKDAVGQLGSTARKDLERINAYWARYDTPVGDAASDINSGRQENYGQNLQTQSYGAVVDLLVAYYKEGRPE